VREERTGRLREVPPCGHVAGLAAATDLMDGVQRAPAGRDLANVEALTVDLDDATHGLLNDEGINAVRRAARTGVRVLGARTLSSDPAWRWLNVRRLISSLAGSLEHGLQWSVHEPNDDRLRDVVRIAISSLLRGVWERGGLRGGTADEAFFVVSDASNNPPAVTGAGQLAVDVGVAVGAPAEFLVLRVGRVAGELTVAEAVPSGTAA
jgi:phage tail sheath protein FI